MLRGIKRQTMSERPFASLHDLCDYLQATYPGARQDPVGTPLAGRYLVLFYHRHRASFAAPATLEEHRFGWFTKLVIPRTGTTLYHRPDGFADWPDFRRTMRKLADADAGEAVGA